MDDACDRSFKVRDANESKLANVKAPCNFSSFGRTKVLMLDPVSTENEPLISCTLLKVMVPLAEDEIVTLPWRVSQLVRLFASL